MKASASVSYIHDAIISYPHIDVVVPHDVYDQLSNHPELFTHLVDSHEHLGDLTHQVSEGIAHAEIAGIHYHVPVLAFLFAAHQSYSRYRKGDLTLTEALQKFGERSLLAAFAMGVGWAAEVLTHKTVVGIPFAMGARLVGGQLLHNRDQRKVLDAEIEIIKTSRRYLELAGGLGLRLGSGTDSEIFSTTLA